MKKFFKAVFRYSKEQSLEVFKRKLDIYRQLCDLVLQTHDYGCKAADALKDISNDFYITRSKLRMVLLQNNHIIPDTVSVPVFKFLNIDIGEIDLAAYALLAAETTNAMREDLGLNDIHNVNMTCQAFELALKLPRLLKEHLPL